MSLKVISMDNNSSEIYEKLRVTRSVPPSCSFFHEEVSLITSFRLNLSAERAGSGLGQLTGE